MGNTRGKNSYLTQVSLERFLSRNLPNVWLATFTFKENVTDKAEAYRRWKPIADLLKRHKVEWLGVWQQQRRGAWHHHVLINRYMDINRLRPFAVARGWGTFINLEKIGDGGYRFVDTKRVVGYLTRYLSRDMCGHVPFRVRLVSAKRGLMAGSVRFSWVEGMAKAWRVGCDLWAAVNGRIPRTDRDRTSAFDMGLSVLGYLEFEPITLNGPNPYQ